MIMDVAGRSQERIGRAGAILLGGQDYGVLRSRARLAEELGFDLVGVGDVPMHYRDVNVCLAVVAEATSRIRIGPMVTNPVSRHPGVVASAAASLDALSGGRLVLGLGAGGGPLFSMGLSVPKRPELRRATATIRSLLLGEASEWEGRPLTFSPRRPVPVYLAAYGLITARIAGEVADGVLFAGGVSPGVITSALQAVADGASAAGRDPGEVDFWVMTRASVGSTAEDAYTPIKANLASAGSHGLRSEAQLATVPGEFVDAVRELQRRYDQSEHVKWDGANARLVDEVGLTSFLAERFAIAGTPEHVRRRFDDLVALGVTRVLVPAVDREPEQFLEAFAAALA
jgi:alkanesulfonate monooxygenase SsuD/methylene tetrahydromethanopterin reductase-like flavin-dependent oxidoreductase (luciferase family)